MIKLRRATASQEIPLGYYLDSTDGNTEETGLTIAATDIKIWKSGATTLANKNSGGATHISNGVYYATLDATDTDTVGPLVIFSHVSGALAVRLECEVLHENVYDVHFGTVAPATATNITAGTITTTTNLTNLPAITSNWLTAAGIAAGALNGKGDWNIGKTGYALSSAGIQAIWDALTSALTAVGSVGKLIVDNVNATISSRASQTSVDTIDDFLDAEISAILADTNELQTDWADGGRLDLILDARASQTSVDTIDDLVDTEIATIIATLGTPAGASLAADIAAIEAQTDDIGAGGAGLTAIPWNSAWDAQVESEVSDALAVYDPPTYAELLNLVRVLARSDAGIATDLAAVLTAINTDLGSGGGTYDNTLSGLENIGGLTDQIDSNIGVGGANLAFIPWNSAWDTQIESEVDDALVARNLDKLVLTSGTADSGSTTTMVDAARTESDADYWKGKVILFTSGNIAGQSVIITDFNAGTDTFTFAPATTQAVSTQSYIILPNVSVWDDVLADHLTSGSAGSALNAASSAGDPWATALPGAYGAGTAGKIIGDNLNATVSSRASQTSVDTIDDFLDTEISAIKAQTDLLDFTNGSLAADVQQWLGALVPSPIIDGTPIVDVRYLNGSSTSGNNATLSLKQLNIINNVGTAVVARSTGNNGHGIEATGHGTGKDFFATTTDGLEVNATQVSGDSVAADRLELFADSFVTGTAQGGATTYITLAAGESATDDIYYGYTVLITSGTGAGQTASITQYTGVTKNAEVFPVFRTAPDNTSVYLLIPHGVVQADVNGVRHDNQRAIDLEALLSEYNVDGRIPADMEAINTDTVAAANLEAILDGTGGTLTGDLTGTVASLSDNGAGLTSIPWSAAWGQDVRDAMKLAPSVGAPAAGSIDTMLTTIDDFIDTEVAAILEDTGTTLPAQIAALSIPTAAAIADAVWDETLADHLTAGSTGNALNAAGSAGDPWSTVLPAAYGVGTAGKIIGDNLDATISSRASQTSLDTLDNLVDTEVAAILEDTGTTLPAQIAALSIPTAAAIADAVWDEATAGHTTVGTYGRFTPADVVSWNGDSTYLTALNDIMEQYLAAGSVNVNLKAIGDVNLVTGTAQSGTTSSIRLAAGESAVANIYIGYLVLITSGTGVKQVRYINGYNGTTKDASVTPAFTTSPDNTSAYVLIPLGLAGADILAILSDEASATNLQNVVAEYGNEGYLPANVTGWNSSPVATPDTAGYPVVTIKDGTGQGEVSITSGRVGVNLDDTAGTLAKGTDITGFNDLDASGIRSALGVATANIDTQLSGIQSDTNDIQARIPTSLIGGRMDSNVGSFIVAESRVNGTCTESGQVQTFTTDLTETEDDYFAGWVLMFTTAGTNRAVPRVVRLYNGTTKEITLVTPLPANTTSGHLFALIALTAGAELTDGSMALNRSYTASAVLDAEIAGFLTPGTVGEAINDAATNTGIDAAGIRAAIGMASANLDTQLGTLSTNVSAVQTKTDNLPTDPADQSAVEAAITAATSGLATAANLATLTGLVDTEVAAILEDTGTTLPAQIAALNNLSAAQVNTEVDTALSDIHLNRLFATDYDPANKPGVATALLNELIGNDAGVSQFTANALELAPAGGGGGGATAEEVWEYATRTLTTPLTSVDTTVSNTTVTMYRGDTFNGSFTGLGALGTWENIYLTIKRADIDVRDEQATIQILLTNPASGSDGLVRLNARSTTAAWASITVDSAVNGDLTVAISENATRQIEPGEYLFDIAYINNTGSSTVAAGTWTIRADVTRAI